MHLVLALYLLACLSECFQFLALYSLMSWCECIQQWLRICWCVGGNIFSFGSIIVGVLE